MSLYRYTHLQTDLFLFIFLPCGIYSVSGDDWDLSQNGDHVIAKKTSYPHPEGAWAWGNTMDQVILQLRNPRWAIPSYMTMRHELQYSQNWTESFGRKEFVYTERPSQAEWEIWRDLKFNTELDRWGWVIDFWMGNGHRRNDGDGNAYQDENCGTNIADCRPVVIIAFEKLYDPISGVEETTRLAHIMNHAEIPLIAEETWPCVFEKTMGNHQPGFKLNANRAGKNGAFPFTLQQLRIIKTELERIKTEYSESGWSLNEAAAEIVGYMDHYIADIDSEIATL